MTVPFTWQDVLVLLAIWCGWLFINWIAGLLYARGMNAGVKLALDNLHKTNLTVDVLAQKDGYTIEIITSTKKKEKVND